MAGSRSLAPESSVAKDLVVRTTRTSVDASNWIQDRIRHCSGLRIQGTGLLREPSFGHPAGSEYVRIRAATTRDCDVAQALLGSVARLPDLAWECGWDLDAPTGAIDGFELSIFPLAPEG